MTTSRRRRAADLSKVDWAAIDAITDDEIERAVAKDPEAAPVAIDEDFTRGQVVYPEPKTLVSLRLDSDVLQGFRGAGRGYQTKINTVLREFAVKQGWIARSAAGATRKPGRPRKTG